MRSEVRTRLYLPEYIDIVDLPCWHEDYLLIFSIAYCVLLMIVFIFVVGICTYCLL